MKKNIILPFLILLFCLSACAHKQDNSIQANENPFAATGLLAHPDETAEEILLRAHTQDPEAMLLVFAGYSLGMDGFPKDAALADAWEDVFSQARLIYTSMFMVAIGTHINYPSSQIGPDLCNVAKDSFAVPLFKQAKIFDLEALCPYTGYKTNKSNIDSSARQYESEKRTLIELINSPITKQETKSLHAAAYASPEFIGYQVATAGNQRASTHEQQLNLLRFTTQRKAESFLESKKLYDAATNKLMQTSSAEAYAPVTLKIIHKAHQADPTATRQMAENYHSGALGFPKNSFLAEAWLKRAAMMGDKNAWTNLALWSYVDSLPKYAWKNAHIATIYGDQKMKDVFAWIIKKTEKDFDPEELKSLQNDLEKELQQIKTSGHHTQ